MQRNSKVSAVLVCSVVAAIGVTWAWLVRDMAASGEWPGVDESVIGEIAQRAGRPESEPLLAWVQGDVLLFMFLIAGLGAGFVIGYFARITFVEQRESKRAGMNEHAG